MFLLRVSTRKLWITTSHNIKMIPILFKNIASKLYIYFYVCSINMHRNTSHSISFSLNNKYFPNSESLCYTNTYIQSVFLCENQWELHCNISWNSLNISESALLTCNEFKMVNSQANTTVFCDTANIPNSQVNPRSGRRTMLPFTAVLHMKQQQTNSNRNNNQVK